MTVGAPEADAGTSPIASGRPSCQTISAVPPARLTKSRTHSPARTTSSPCSGSALTLGIAIHSESSAIHDWSTPVTARTLPAVAHEIVGAGAFARRLVVRIEQPALGQGQAPAADARREPGAKRLQGLDPVVEIPLPR